MREGGDRIDEIEAEAYTVPTASPESDGTAQWDSTTLILVRARGLGGSGLGYTYADSCCVPLIREKLAPLIKGKSALAISPLWRAMNVALRNVGRRGLAAAAMAAIEMALWDLKARLLRLPFVHLIGLANEEVPIYGSGGFTAYPETQLCEQLAGWAAEGMTMVKMKIGRQPELDPGRVAAARRAIGPEVELFVDANGAFTPKQACGMARRFAESGVSWFEEPVTSDDLSAMRFVRERASMDIAMGEYNYDLRQARAALEAQAADVLQADATRCGVIGFLQTDQLCEAWGVPLSAHTAPALHAHLGCVSLRFRHLEYFFDHTRIEQMFFDGATTRHQGGFMRPDLSQPGFGLEFKEKDAAKFKVNV